MARTLNFQCVEYAFLFYKPPNQKVMVRVSLNLQNFIVRLQSLFSK